MKFTKELRKSMAVACRIIQKSENLGVTISAFKVIKLMYIADLMHRSLCKKPLLEEKFIQTQYGPNLFSIFILLKPFGSGLLRPSSSYLIAWKGNLEVSEKQSIDEAVINWGALSDKELIEAAAQKKAS